MIKSDGMTAGKSPKKRGRPPKNAEERAETKKDVNERVGNGVKTPPDVNERVEKLAAEQKKLVEVINAMWTLSASHQGARYVTKNIKETYNNPYFKLSKHVYDTYIDSNGDKKALLALLESVLGTSTASSTVQKQDFDGATSASSTASDQKNPNLNTNLG